MHNLHDFSSTIRSDDGKKLKAIATGVIINSVLGFRGIAFALNILVIFFLECNNMEVILFHLRYKVCKSKRLIHFFNMNAFYMSSTT